MPTEVLFRRATAGDLRDCHDVMWRSVTEFGVRNGTALQGTADDWWAGMAGLHGFLAANAAEWWVAEEGGDVVGFARSIEREGLFELTEFFVLPGRQAAGLGRQLLDRSFPLGRGDVRSIIATTDVRALRRYYAAGCVPRFPMLTFTGTPTSGLPDGDLTPQPIDAERDLEAVRLVDRFVLEHARGDAELRWLLEGREGFLYLRNGEPAGFAFVGEGGTGPIAALDPGDLPDILLHVEGRAAARGFGSIELQVPGPNEVAARHLLARGFRVDPWINLLMSNREFGRFDRVLPFGPPLFL
ncbi:MAG TPA: GNAT family N-acetyltransferase [Actinomycetota bacterium]|nr:GNAT family N-acetyltransferase [Actinomycetota bacterium]